MSRRLQPALRWTWRAAHGGIYEIVLVDPSNGRVYEHYQTVGSSVLAHNTCDHLNEFHPTGFHIPRRRA